MANVSTDGFIRNGLPGKPMRMAMETKDLLRQKGSIYVGTGNSRTITLVGEDEGEGTSYTIYETEALNPPSETGTYVLKCINGTLQWVAD